MSNGLIPQRYAKALYKLAEEKGTTEAVYDEMKEVATAFERNPQLAKVMANPFVSREDKARLLELAAGDKAEDDYRGFVRLILDNHREEYARLMALAYRDMYRHRHGLAEATLVTAAPLGDEETAKIKRIVDSAYPGLRLEWNTRVNPDLIGGFMVDVDGNRLDASVRNELEQLRLKLLRSN